MKALACIAMLAVAGGVAHGQLDRILAPVAESPAEAAPGEGDVAKPAAAAPVEVVMLSEDEVTAEIARQLVSYFGVKGDLKLSFLRGWSPVQLPGKDFVLTITGYPPQGVASTFGLRFRVTSGKEQVGEWEEGFAAQLWQSIWVTQGRLERGQAVDRNALTTQKIDVLQARETLISDDVDPDGLDAAQSIAAGTPLNTQEVAERPMIHRGDVVDVVAVQGPLDIHMKAQALEDGAKHALIRMRNLDSSKEFSAQIMNENEVTVHF